MNIRQTIPALLAAAALFAFTGNAGATVYTLTATGTIDSGTDYDGLFGAADADLTGLAFTVVESVDSTTSTLDPSNQGINEFNPVVMTTTATVNGLSFSYIRSTNSSSAGFLVFANSPLIPNFYGFLASDARSGITLETTNGFLSSSSFDQTVSYSVVDGDTASVAFFNLTSTDPDGATSFSSGHVSTVALDFENPADAPEPASLALFGIGVAGLGLARRKAKPTQV